MFAVEYRDKLDEKIKSLSEHILSHPLPQEEYILHVGSVQALTEAREDFNNLIKAFFAREL